MSVAAERLRAIALALPGVEERETWAKPTFRVAGRLFLTLAADGSSATIKASPAEQEALVSAEPTVYSKAAYVGRYGWIAASLAHGDPDELSRLVVDAWRHRSEHSQ